MSSFCIGGGVEGVDSGVDVTLGDATGQDSGRVQVSKSSGGGGVSQVICGNIDDLESGVSKTH